MENRLEKHSNLFIEIMPKGNFVVPRIAKQGSIGYDLVVPEDFTVPARSRGVYSDELCNQSAGRS